MAWGYHGRRDRRVCGQERGGGRQHFHQGCTDLPSSPAAAPSHISVARAEDVATLPAGSRPSPRCSVRCEKGNRRTGCSGLHLGTQRGPLGMESALRTAAESDQVRQLIAECPQLPGSPRLPIYRLPGTGGEQLSYGWSVGLGVLLP